VEKYLKLALIVGALLIAIDVIDFTDNLLAPSPYGEGQWINTTHYEYNIFIPDTPIESVSIELKHLVLPAVMTTLAFMGLYFSGRVLMLEHHKRWVRKADDEDALMPCKHCGFDLYPIYEAATCSGMYPHPLVKITNYQAHSDCDGTSESWDTEIKCPKCRNIHTLSDGNP
jgi:hypothetical protein